MDPKFILISPVITERSLALGQFNRYTFWVATGATKNQIKTAVETQFSVHVESVRTQTYKSVAKRTGKKRLPTHTPKRKKAIVQLKTGETIKLFEING
jgi:large subunit ribosomal protein L23